MFFRRNRRANPRKVASPVTGSGVAIPRFQQLLLLAMEQGKKTAADQARFVWSVLSGQGQRLVREGKPIDSEKENIEELTVMARDFAANRLPVLKALDVLALVLIPIQVAARSLSELADLLPLSCLCP